MVTVKELKKILRTLNDDEQVFGNIHVIKNFSDFTRIRTIDLQNKSENIIIENGVDGRKLTLSNDGGYKKL